MSQQTIGSFTEHDAPLPDETAAGASLLRRRRWFAADALLRGLTAMAAVVVLLMLFALLGVLFKAAMPTMRAFGWGFLTTSEWRVNPLEVPLRGADGKVVIEDGEVVM